MLLVALYVCFVLEKLFRQSGVAGCVTWRVQLNNIQQRPLATAVFRVRGVCIPSLSLCQRRQCAACGQLRAQPRASSSFKPAYQRRFLYLLCSLPSAISFTSACLSLAGYLALAALPGWCLAW